MDENVSDVELASLPALPESSDSKIDLHFLEQVIEATAGTSRLEMCIQCGTCGGTCPSVADMDQTPRKLFAMIRAGMKDEVLRSNTQWICVSCYQCGVRCPQGVHITDVMYALKNMAIRGKLYADDNAPSFSKTFIDYVENFGRSFELGLATRFFLRHHPLRLPSMAPMAFGMFLRGRMDLTPHRIEGIDQLKAILARAKEMEVEHG